MKRGGGGSRKGWGAHYVIACLYGLGKVGKTKTTLQLLCGNIGTTKKMNKANLAQHFTSNFLI